MNTLGLVIEREYVSRVKKIVHHSYHCNARTFGAFGICTNVILSIE